MPISNQYGAKKQLQLRRPITYSSFTGDFKVKILKLRTSSLKVTAYSTVLSGFWWHKPTSPVSNCVLSAVQHNVQLPSFMTVSEPKRMKSSTSTPSIQFSSANDLKKTSWSGTMQCRIKETIASLASETSNGRSHITGWEVVWPSWNVESRRKITLFRFRKQNELPCPWCCGRTAIQ